MSTKAGTVSWISHRGVTTHAVENTRDAFTDAVAAGFDTLETDLLATRDGVIMLAHDDDLSHVSEATHRVSESTYSELASIRLRDDQQLLRFEEFVEEFAGRRWILDVKPETAYSVIDALGRLMEDRAVRTTITGQARFLCWTWRHQRYCRSRMPDVTFMAREWECYRAGLACLCRLPSLGGIKPGTTYSLTARFRGMELFTPRIIDAYHQRGASVLAYLPDSEREIDAALEAGADEIILDYVTSRLASSPKADQFSAS